jgi:hypothetical protein
MQILTSGFIILPFLIVRKVNAVFLKLPATWAGILKKLANPALGLKFLMNIVLKGCQIISLPGALTCFGLAPKKLLEIIRLV